MRRTLRQAKVVIYLAVAIPMSPLSEALADPPYGKPIYNPATKSYFELRADNSTPGSETDSVWLLARNRAATYEYKGIRGRLAIVTDLQTHNFLARNFKIDSETWIGLRYWCNFRKLTWVDGSFHEPGSFSAWAQSWHRTDLPPCESAGTAHTGFMSVYYRPTASGFSWQAVGSSKGFRRYFVEYPTGARAESDTSEATEQ